MSSELAPPLVLAYLHHGMPAVMSANDVVRSTSDNGGTPVRLIKAQTAELPVVSTRLGGVPSALFAALSGRLVGPDEVKPFADGVRGPLADTTMRPDFDVARRDHLLARLSIERLVDDVDRSTGGRYGRRA